MYITSCSLSFSVLNLLFVDQFLIIVFTAMDKSKVVKRLKVAADEKRTAVVDATAVCCTSAVYKSMD